MSHAGAPAGTATSPTAGVSQHLSAAAAAGLEARQLDGATPTPSAGGAAAAQPAAAAAPPPTVVRLHLTRQKFPEEILAARAKRKSARRGPTRKRAKAQAVCELFPIFTSLGFADVARDDAAAAATGTATTTTSTPVTATARAWPSAPASTATEPTPTAVLLVGEMDLSFAMDCSQHLVARPAARGGPLLHLCATTYFDEATIPKKIRGLFRNSARVLRKRGVDVQTNVDATRLDDPANLDRRRSRVTAAPPPRAATAVAVAAAATAASGACTGPAAVAGIRTSAAAALAPAGSGGSASDRDGGNPTDTAAAPAVARGAGVAAACPEPASEATTAAAAAAAVGVGATASSATGGGNCGGGGDNSEGGDGAPPLLCFDAVVFCFPRGSSVSGVRTENDNLLSGFFRSAGRVLRPGGNVVVLLHTAWTGGVPQGQYEAWDIAAIAAAHGFVLQRRLPLQLEHFASYRPRDCKGRAWVPQEAHFHFFQQTTATT